MTRSRQGDQDALVDIDLEIKFETERAVRVDDAAGKACWLPLSLIEIDRDRSPPRITMPLWLAEERNLA